MPQQPFNIYSTLDCVICLVCAQNTVCKLQVTTHKQVSRWCESQVSLPWYWMSFCQSRSHWLLSLACYHKFAAETDALGAYHTLRSSWWPVFQYEWAFLTVNVPLKFSSHLHKRAIHQLVVKYFVSSKTVGQPNYVPALFILIRVQPYTFVKGMICSL